MRHGLTQQKIVHHALVLLLIAALSAIFLYITRQVIIGASREIEFDLRNDIFANLERQSAQLLPHPSHRRHHGPHHQRPQRRPPAPRPRDHVQREHHRLHRRRAALHVPHQPQADLLRLRPSAHRLRPRPVLRRPHPSPLRAHPGHVLRHLRQGPGELLRRPPHPRLRPGRGRDRLLRDRQSGVHHAAASISSASWPCSGPRSSSSSASPS